MNDSLYESKKIFTENEAVSLTLLMLQGVTNQLYLLKKEKLTFVLRPNVEIQGYSLNDEALNDIFEDLI